MTGKFPFSKILVDPVFTTQGKVLNAAFNNGRLKYTTTLTILGVVHRRGLVRGTLRAKACLVRQLRRLRSPLVGRVQKHKLVIKIRLAIPIGKMHRPLLFRRQVFANCSKLCALEVLPPLMLSGGRISVFMKDLGGILSKCCRGDEWTLWDFHYYK